jgi:predicted dehydrogenase
MIRTINWGILGTGNIAKKFALALQHVPNSRLLAIASRNENSANEFAAKHNAQKSYGNYLELALDSEIDVVYIATPHVFHFENTMMCLNNNKAVLCEKPFAMNADEVRQMIALAREKKLFLMEALWTRFLPSIIKTMELIENDTIGQIIQLKSDFGFKANFDPKNRIFNKALGGGSLLDIGIYPVFISLLLLGYPSEILSKAVIGKTDIDESVSMIFKYDNGALSDLSSTVLAQTFIETDIYGTKGRIRINNPWFMSRSVSLTLSDGKKEDYHFDFICNGYEYEAMEVTNCLLEGKTESTIMTHDFSLKLIGLLDEVRRQNDF